MIYFDNNATTMLASEVLQEMGPFLSFAYGNPSSIYPFAAESRRAIEEARERIAESLGGISARQIVFTSGGTESNNTAIRSALKSFPNKKKIVTSKVEHSSVKNLCEQLGQEGYEIVWINVTKTGALDIHELKSVIDERTALVSLMWANNETGVVFPMDEIAALVKQKNILFHVDAVQMVGKISIDLRKSKIDFLSASAHKFHGPKGIGFLYVKEGTPFQSLIAGGRQERDRRAGTENVSGIVGMGKALKVAREGLNSHSVKISELRNRLEQELVKRIPDSFVNGKNELRLPNTTNITIPGVEAEALLIRLGNEGICASSGSACLTGAVEPSHVLQAMGLSEELSFSSLRFSLSRYTTEKEIDQVIEIVPKIVNELRILNSKK